LIFISSLHRLWHLIMFWRALFCSVLTPSVVHHTWHREDNVSARDASNGPERSGTFLKKQQVQYTTVPANIALPIQPVAVVSALVLYRRLSEERGMSGTGMFSEPQPCSPRPAETGPDPWLGLRGSEGPAAQPHGPADPPPHGNTFSQHVFQIYRYIAI
jgi:hypothetical protein